MKADSSKAGDNERLVQQALEKFGALNIAVGIFPWRSIWVAISAGIFVGLGSVDTPGSVLDNVIHYKGRQDNIAIREAAMVALFFNLIMVVIAIIAIMKTIPKQGKVKLR